MKKKIKICFVGGGSYSWGPTLIRDIMFIPGLQEIEFRLLDINLTAANLIARLGRKMAKTWDRPATFIPTKDETQAFKGADFVLICISTGGLAAMKHDLRIPAKYGIHQPVGDTVGPGGWARSMRNIPVFIGFAERARECCPEAPILNYTNPLATLTRVLAEFTEQPVVGLCHALFGTYDTIQKVLGLKSQSDIKASLAGLNHFFWILDMKIKEKDGLEMLRRRLKGRNIDDLYQDMVPDAHGFSSHCKVAGELFNEYGYLPFTGDRHITEFFPHYLTRGKGMLEEYAIRLTSIEDRQHDRAARHQEIKDMLSGKKEMDPNPSDEIAANFIECMAKGEEIIDVVNLPNRGQVPDLPYGTVVETMGVVNSLGFKPVCAGPMPESLVETLMPHAVNQEWTVEAALSGDWDLAYKALINDPLCSHLSIPEVKKMGKELLTANKRYLPQFFKESRKKRSR